MALIRGSVRDTEGSPVSYARVAFQSAPVHLPDVALLTDEAGHFTAGAPAPGIYVLSIYADGFAAATCVVERVGESDAIIDIRLNKPVGEHNHAVVS
jgi:hypothetical protein